VIKAIGIRTGRVRVKAIAYQAGISAATLNRRLAELMKSLGTRTRFQLGWRAALERYSNGWRLELGANGLPLLNLPTE
jgi:hypothetical protein